MYIVERTHHINRFSQGMAPVLEVEDGAVILFQANDCFTQQVQSEADVVTELDPESLNPATGPVHVKGAQVNDLLKVDILDIKVADMGCMAIINQAGFLADQCDQAVTKMIPIEGGRAIFNDLAIPIDPMIGVIGVAPKVDEGEWTTDTPWKHGGNMDTTDIRKGTTLYFPVGEEGAQLALGDCHALMGDGEVCITGLEIPADVLVRVSVIKDKALEWPLLEKKEATLVIGSGEDLEKATHAAMTQAVKLLSQSLGMSWEDAYMLASMVVNGKISQVVNPMKTVRAEIPKGIVSTETLLASLGK